MANGLCFLAEPQCSHISRTIASGVFNSITNFTVTSIVARGIRFFSVALFLWWLGPPIRSFIERRLGLITILFFALLVCGFMLVKYAFKTKVLEFFLECLTNKHCTMWNQIQNFRSVRADMRNAYCYVGLAISRGALRSVCRWFGTMLTLRNPALSAHRCHYLWLAGIQEALG